MTTALYRRYRPQTFAEVIGQDHVTAPLRAALRTGQVNHAYLFSGPRGCGKTSSARILARILNCEQNTPEHPTDTPCGVCPSCVELATGGPGSLDVVEIDAASHGGVDDARELRERATFAPARDRYKVFIIDEAHMVSNQGFNALLKIVEEPPPHVRFVFATTEPDKVIATIRSRTHHYPFRLVPPDVMVPFLQHVCDEEGVTVGTGVLPLVVRAGAGSVRDSLSVLDQLIAGSGGNGLEYDDAVALLGYTPSALLDDLVDAVAARDGATAFSVVERIIATGHEPRRFVEDLLERLRDLIVIAAAGPAAEAALGALPVDQMARMAAQAQHLGWSELSRSADLANAALTEMVGATSPRLHLELLMARLLLPAADDGAAGFGARLDRLERGWPTSAGGAVRVASAPATAAVPGAPVPVAPVPAVEKPRYVFLPDDPAQAVNALREEGGLSPLPADVPGAAHAEEPVTAAAAGASPDAAPGPTRSEAAPPAPGRSASVADASSTDEPPTARTSAPESDEPPAARTPTAPVAPPTAATPVVPPVTAATPQVTAPARAAGQDTEMLRRRWPEVLETVKGLRRTTWILVGQNAQVHDLDASVLRLSFPTNGLVDRFREHADVVARAVRETLGFDVHVQAVLASAPVASGSAPTGAVPMVPTSAAAPAGSSGATPPRGIPTAAEAAASWDAPTATPPARSSSAPVPSSGAAEPAEPSGAAEPADADDDSDDEDDVPPIEPQDDDEPAPEDAPPDDGGRPAPPEEDEPSPDDPLIEGSNLVGAPLVARLLGGTVIDEQVEDPGR